MQERYVIKRRPQDPSSTRDTTDTPPAKHQPNRAERRRLGWRGQGDFAAVWGGAGLMPESASRRARGERRRQRAHRRRMAAR